MITSLENERVKRVRSLQTRGRARHKEERFVVEGATLAQEAAATGVPIEEVYYTETFAATAEGWAILNRLSDTGAALMTVSDPVMQSMSDLPAPQGLLAVLPALKISPPEAFSFALILDRIADPGNLGAIMRSAAAAGVPVLFVTAGTVDVTNPKVLRSGMGAHFRLPVIQMSWEGIVRRLADHAIFLAETEGGAAYFDVDWTQPCALIVSEEAHGPGEDAARAAHARITIPMPGGIDSLNVAMATSILLFERVRQQMQTRRE